MEPGGGGCCHALSRPTEDMKPFSSVGRAAMYSPGLIATPHVLVGSSRVKGLPHFAIVFTHIEDWVARNLPL